MIDLRDGISIRQLNFLSEGLPPLPPRLTPRIPDHGNGRCAHITLMRLSTRAQVSVMQRAPSDGEVERLFVLGTEGHCQARLDSGRR